MSVYCRAISIHSLIVSFLITQSFATSISSSNLRSFRELGRPFFIFLLCYVFLPRVHLHSLDFVPCTSVDLARRLFIALTLLGVYCCRGFGGVCGHPLLFRPPVAVCAFAAGLLGIIGGRSSCDLVLSGEILTALL